MAEQSAGLHEPAEKLAPATIDRHRAIVSLMEELEAIDWYDQRVAATTNNELAAILAHNRDEEKEHAAMTLEWLRRRDPVLDEQLRRYLFTTLPVVEVEEAAEGGGGDREGARRARGVAPPGAQGPGGGDGSLRIGSQRVGGAGEGRR
ncbi:MAG: encapsulin-associated ferritin-like protein [Acidimicrobiales bacterium]